MEATLVIVTLVSLAAAIGLAIVTWRLLQDERHRADARVAALEEGLAASLAAQPAAVAAAATAPLPASASAAAGAAARARRLGLAHDEGDARGAAAMPGRANGGTRAAAAGAAAEIVELHSDGDPDWLAQFPPSTTHANGHSYANGTHANGTRVMHMAGTGASNESDIPTQPIAAPAFGTRAADAPAGDPRAGDALFGDTPVTDALASDALVGDIGGTPASDAFAADRLFSEGDAAARVGASSRGLLAIGVGGAVIVLLIVALWSVGRLMAPGVDSRAAASAKAATAASAAPLELVALEQTREGQTLTIHGVVRNPPAGVMIDRLAVVVAFFDVSGQQLATVRAPLDFRTLAPGDESPFQVTTSVPVGVTRYRVSFRRDEGTIVPHVDRRQQEAS
jgi:hypothetical protein